MSQISVSGLSFYFMSTRNVVVTTEKNGFPFFPGVTTTFLALCCGWVKYVGALSMWG